MPLRIYLSGPQGRKPVTLPTHFTLDDFRFIAEKKVGPADHFDYSLGEVIIRTWNEDVFNRQRSAIRDGVTIVAEYPPLGVPGRQPLPGLCFEGVCLNIQCISFERKVIINRGFGHFNVLQENMTCPLCNASVQPIFYAFYQCSWKIDAIRSNTEDKIVLDGQQTLPNEYRRGSELLSSWSQLIIETKR